MIAVSENSNSELAHTSANLHQFKTGKSYHVTADHFPLKQFAVPTAGRLLDQKFG